MVMLHLWSIRQLFLYFLLSEFYVRSINADWPSLTDSNVQLLGLFQDPENATQSQTTNSSVHARAMFKAAIMLSHQLNLTIDKQLLGWQVAQTGGTAIGAVSSGCRLMTISNIVGIVGPSYSRETPVIASLAGTIGIPTISYGATAPALSDEHAYPAFYRTIPSDNTAALAIVTLFTQHNWTSCIILYQNDEFGNGGVDAITQGFNNNSLVIIQTLLYEISTQSFRGGLNTTLLSSASRIVILWAEPLHATIILQQALDNDVLGPQFLWILSSSVSLNSFNRTSYSKLAGMIIIEPTVGSVVNAPTNTTLLNAAYNIWQQYEPETFPESSQVHNYGLFAFDATWTLIGSLQKLCSMEMNDSLPCLSVTESTVCFDSRFIHSNQLFDTVRSAEFLGVSGPIQFSNDTNDRISGTYYLAKNVQASSNALNYMSVLQWSGSRSWQATAQSNAIIWPGNSSIPPTGFPGLIGITLRICVVAIPPFTMTREVMNGSGQTTTEFVGYAIDLIDRLQARLGFIYKLILVSSNQTSDQIIQGVVNNDYDLIVSDITITATRRKVVDFSNSIFDNSLRVIVRQTSSIESNLVAFLKPFSVSLWLVLLAALLYASVLIFILERQENAALKEKSMISAAAMSVWYSFGTLAGYGVDFHVETAAGRLLSVGLYILSIILVASYTANLASDLTITRSSNIVSGIDDIKNGEIPFSRVGIVIGGAVEEYYLREVSGNSRNYYPLKSPADIYTALLANKIDAAISDGGILGYATNTLYCNLTLVGSEFDPSAFGIVMRKQWIYAQALDVAILSLRESGALEYLETIWFETKNCSGSSSSSSVVKTSSYSIAAVGGLFLIFVVISILSLILFAWVKRFIIRDYFMKLAHRKGWFIKKHGAVEAHSMKNYNEHSQTFQTDLNVSSEACL